MDFISTITIDFEGTKEEISEKNYKDILKSLEYGITSSENDIDIIDERIEELIENFPSRSDENRAEMEKKYESLQQQRKENRKFIDKCENTIELIEKIADLRGWE